MDFKFIIVFTVLMVISNAASYMPEIPKKKCDKCINVYECPLAVDLFNKKEEESDKMLINAFCGYGEDKNPKVCCDDLIKQIHDDLENHPNLHLLPSDCGKYDGKRIVGGVNASIHEFPWMVLISYRTRLGRDFQCGGSLINDRYVLTAAHCIQHRRIIGVRVGDFDIDNDLDCQGESPDIVCESHIQDLRVEESFIHEDFPRFSNDIGLIRLQTPVDFSPENAGPICLPTTTELRYRNIAGRNSTVAGWGITDNGHKSNVLLKVILPVYSSNRCNYFYRNKIPDDGPTRDIVYCAGEQGKDSCNGDSGGPLVIEGVYQFGQRYIQYGIVSNGPIECGSGNPGVYTSVVMHMKWILDHMRP